MDNSRFIAMIDIFTTNTINQKFNNNVYNEFGDMYEDVQDAYNELYDENEVQANILGLYSDNDKVFYTDDPTKQAILSQQEVNRKLSNKKQ